MVDGTAATWMCSPDHAGRSGSTAKHVIELPGGTLIRRYALAPTPAELATRPRFTATAIPPSSGGADVHSGTATHPTTLTDHTGMAIDRGRDQ
ncbi:hypothetical protein GCM10012278_69550 [Nonomuraea glycinis]|uniref:Uncharacterized protein n=1 Tax=Nonomuraea glycinis TaxID=2047744 RepID=A0A918AC97_9ACTN|nr:hypothetical protein GCM10012278_69550 [Nonomuraea glycinis]